MSEMLNNSMKIKKINAYDQVYYGIKNAIIDKTWKVNEKLPSETELAKMFGVNRMTIRAALQKLNMLSIVETKVGDGTYVKEFDFSDYINEVTELYMKPKLLEDVCDFRKLIEVECAKLAIERSTEQELNELDDICTEFEKLKKQVDPKFDVKDLPKLAKMDLKFHKKICEMSHNEIYLQCFMVAEEPIYQYLMLILNKRVDGWKKKSISILDGDYRHRAIYQAIRNKDYETCRKYYLDMIDHNIEL